MSKLHWLLVTILVAQTGCAPTGPRIATTLNDKAALTGDLPEDPLNWRVITCDANPHEATMSTLFGNDTAVQYARANTEGNYPAGSLLSLVTWRQQEDIRWFGAMMPAQAASVEFVDVRPVQSRLTAFYRVWEGFPLRESSRSTIVADQRTTYLLSLRAAVMP